MKQLPIPTSCQDRDHRVNDYNAVESSDGSMRDRKLQRKLVRETTLPYSYLFLYIQRNIGANFRDYNRSKRE